MSAVDSVLGEHAPAIRPGGHAPLYVRPHWAQIRAGTAGSFLLAISCLVSYWVTTKILTIAYSVSAADDALGGMWAVIATVFVFRDTYNKSLAAALSRMAATLVSFALCLAYLAFLPFHIWALAALVGLSVLVTTLIGRPEDEITAGITTTVVLVVAGLSPHGAWQQPILRLADTAIGVAVGLAAAWIGLRGIPPLARAAQSLQRGTAHRIDRRVRS